MMTKSTTLLHTTWNLHLELKYVLKNTFWHPLLKRKNEL